ncbi:MAG TPA: Rrf2 family transcriptional regulator [Anaeromyxobacteraceae bacterium]|nr:Rrf2 family transcriptional regulator [Anaeromyxobacteraceae bacterium]
MQHVLRVSRKIDYGLRAMIYLASIPQDSIVPFREIARQMDVPEDFLAKILKTLVDQGLVKSTRGPHGGYALARGAAEISFLDVIEAVEGPVAVNVCLDGEDACGHSTQCTMASVWRLGQERMLDVYRQRRLADLAFKPDDDGQIGLVQLQLRDAQARTV